MAEECKDHSGVKGVDPKAMPHFSDRDPNGIAGQWQVNATVTANDKDYRISDRIALYRFKRAATRTPRPSPSARGRISPSRASSPGPAGKTSSTTVSVGRR
ncbi:hypothetical protein [Streptomyces cyaneofuscatus]|uniref:hypothetical protein n=1 Tax=Streptomyces cyaneofuscatus TaxID=66883 RepID=UPI003660B43C